MNLYFENFKHTRNAVLSNSIKMENYFKPYRKREDFKKVSTNMFLVSCLFFSNFWTLGRLVFTRTFNPYAYLETFKNISLDLGLFFLTFLMSLTKSMVTIGNVFQPLSFSKEYKEFANLKLKYQDLVDEVQFDLKFVDEQIEQRLHIVEAKSSSSTEVIVNNLKLLKKPTPLTDDCISKLRLYESLSSQYPVIQTSQNEPAVDTLKNYIQEYYEHHFQVKDAACDAIQSLDFYHNKLGL